MIYPNPTADYIRVNNIKNTKLRLYDCNGKIVKIITDVDKPIDVSVLPRGIYLLKYDDGRVTSKV